MDEILTTRCCVAGGGPAGMMLGFLLARAGIDVVVLEKHGDFLRDFHGDTVHPSTLQVMHELGLLDAFLTRPHDELRRVGLQIGDRFVQIADFTHLPTRCGFVAFMPQWEFLDFLAVEARRYPQFRLMMRTEATGLLLNGELITGVSARTEGRPVRIEAELVIAADGRHSVLRDAAGLEVEDLGAPMDVLWLRLSRKDSDPSQTLGRIDAGRMFIALNRGEYWQCAFIIAKGGFGQTQSAGLPAFQAEIVRLTPYLADRVQEIDSWDKVKLLTVAVDRLRQWYQPGLLLIGDAAHAMSPIGGVGINLAVQDAVAAANVLVPKLRHGKAGLDELRAVQKRRELPTRLTQKLQLLIQNRVIRSVLQSTRTPKPPLLARLLGAFPVLRRLPARIMGMGFRPEHIQH